MPAKSQSDARIFLLQTHPPLSSTCKPAVPIMVLVFVCSFVALASPQGTISRNELGAPVKAREALNRAHVAIAQHDPEAAARHLDLALAHYPDYSAALTTRGMLKVHGGAIEEGMRDLQRAIELDSECGPAFLFLATVKNDRNEYDEALRLLHRGMRLLPSAWQGHLEMARALLGKADATTALGEIRKAESLVPRTIDPFERAYIHFVKARVLVALKDLEDAMSEFELAVRDAPEGPVGDASKSALERLRGANQASK